jgi:hypothetical protein
MNVLAPFIRGRDDLIYFKRGTATENLLKFNVLIKDVKRLNKKVGGALTFDDLIASSTG